MHFRELPTNAVVFLHLPGRPALVILLDITDRKTVQIIIFYDDIIPLGRQHSPLINRSRFESTALEHGCLLYTSLVKVRILAHAIDTAQLTLVMQLLGCFRQNVFNE